MSGTEPHEPDEAAARPLGWETGHYDVDAVLAGLKDLDRLPVSEHIAIFERVHRGLQNVLSEAATDEAKPRQTSVDPPSSGGRPPSAGRAPGS